MGIISGGAVTITAADIDQIVDEVWDEVISSGHAVAGSAGLAQSRLKDTAIAVGDAANSLAQKLRGATDNQAFSSAGITVTDQSSRVSTAENITTTETPPAASLSMYYVICESAAASITTVEISANSGTNYIDPGTSMPTARYWLDDASGSGLSPIPLGATGRFRWTTPAAVGTYIVLVSGASVS